MACCILDDWYAINVRVAGDEKVEVAGHRLIAGERIEMFLYVANPPKRYSLSSCVILDTGNDW